MEHSLSTRNRLGNSGLAVVPAVAATAYAVQADDSMPRLVAILAVLGFAALAVRGYRLGVTYDHSRITIRGYSRTRVIDRDHIKEVTDFPAVRWTARNGRERWTPLTAFMTSTGEFSTTRIHKERALKKLRQWVRRGGGERGRAKTAVPR
ncbi:hypothetical protein OG410_04305 [Streptomyces sp. NBC_00659]|uniref:hypothetical protein n=1 Tax=Streptomyces sp. NBC_00659 TaxID=2903669 RepID=UPI002E2FD9C7|nr:hypothetical protein [Streptomyces sp. NBC_00659]